MTTLPPGFRESFRAPFEPAPDLELLEEVRAMPGSVREGLRNKARHDRYFLAKGILGYKDVNPYTHGPLCRALEDKTRQRRMFLMHRGSLKTTIATITDSIGDALADPEETRILIVNEIEQNAIGFLSEIKAHFENNDLLRELFPELIPERFGGPGSRWSTTQACLPRKSSYKEWTWTAAGIGKAITGNHYSKIKNDDLIGFEARESPAAMRYAIAFAKAEEPLLIDMDENVIDWVGTRWGLQDLYRAMLDAYGEDIAYFAREDIEEVPALDVKFLHACGFGYAGKDRPNLTDEQILAKISTLQPIFPRKFSLKKLHRLSVIDPVLYYAQYKNNPIADGIKDFDSTKLRWFDLDDYGNIIYRGDSGRLQRYARESLDIVMACDPNSGEITAKDPPAIGVYALSPRPDEFVFCLESWSKRGVQPDAFVDKIFEVWGRWHPRVVGIEKAGQQTTEFYFRKKMRDLKVYVNVVPVTPKNREKTNRIRKALQPIINGSRFFVRKSQTNLRHQVQFHPDLENDDELDCAAYATEIFRPSFGSADDDEVEAAAKTVMSRRSSITGY